MPYIRETFLWIICPDASVWSCPSVFARPHMYGLDIHSYEYTALGLLWECFDPTNYCQGSPCLGSPSIRSVNSFRNLMGYECIDLSTSNTSRGMFYNYFKEIEKKLCFFQIIPKYNQIVYTSISN